MNSIDKEILIALLSQGRITWSELANQLGLSSPAIAERVRKLEEAGVIKGFSVQLDPARVGCALTALIAVTLSQTEDRVNFMKLVAEMPQIQECHHITGDDDYQLKVRCKGTKDLEEQVIDRIKSLKGVSRTRTSIVLSSPKEISELPL
ncbi:MAG: Lrp/AsnC family transcriptional regulator [SAR324 cluster bacterium]|nr:Lrp/AsnC family transcriptional regulator [SAR324 cluster bacterium]